MCPEELSIRGESHVDEALLLEEGVEHGEDGAPVVVPLQAELLLRVRPHLGRRGRGQGGVRGRVKSGVRTLSRFAVGIVVHCDGRWCWRRKKIISLCFLSSCFRVRGETKNSFDCETGLLSLVQAAGFSPVLLNRGPSSFLERRFAFSRSRLRASPGDLGTDPNAPCTNVCSVPFLAFSSSSGPDISPSSEDSEEIGKAH